MAHVKIICIAILKLQKCLLFWKLSGIHPNEIRGKKVGVYVGVSESESAEYLAMNPDAISGYELTGCCRAMFANRLSFSMDLKGLFAPIMMNKLHLCKYVCKRL